MRWTAQIEKADGKHPLTGEKSWGGHVQDMNNGAKLSPATALVMLRLPLFPPG